MWANTVGVEYYLKYFDNQIIILILMAGNEGNVNMVYEILNE